MRYLVPCANIVPLHPDTDEPMAAVTWEAAARTLFRDPRVLQAFDVLTLMDLRKAVIGGRHGGVPVGIADDDWAAMLPFVKRPMAFSNEFAFAGEAFFRAWIDAPTKDPSAPSEAVATATNGT